MKLKKLLAELFGLISICFLWILFTYVSIYVFGFEKEQLIVTGAFFALVADCSQNFVNWIFGIHE